MRTCSGHRRIVHSESVLSFVTWSRTPRFVSDGRSGGKVLQRYYIQRNRYSQQIILVNTAQNRTNNAFPACDSTGQ